MTLETFFLILGSISVMPFWGLMIVLPRWRLTERICQQYWMVAIPVTLYVGFLVGSFFNGQVTSLASVNLIDPASLASLLGTPYLAVGAWLHLLAFDLWTGRWIYLDSRKKGLNSLLVSAALFLTLCFGPFGLGLYLIGQFLHPRNLSPE